MNRILLVLAVAVLAWEAVDGADHLTLWQVRMPSSYTSGSLWPSSVLQDDRGSFVGYPVQTLPGDATDATVDGLAAGGWYCWRITAHDATGRHLGWSARACKDFNTIPPPPPTGMKATVAYTVTP